jgi:hypothetical protein
MLLTLVGPGWPARVTPPSARRRLNYGGQPSPERRKRFWTLFKLGWRASRSSGVSRAKERRKNEVKGKDEVRRRSDDAELWRTAFARETEEVLDLVQVRLACQP